jgi:hypothetical protein
MAKKSSEQEYMDEQQNAQLEALQQQQAQEAYTPPAYQQPAQVYQQATDAPPQSAAPAASGMTQEKIDQLKQLGQLRESGILTDTEFEVQKQKLLNG